MVTRQPRGLPSSSAFNISMDWENSISLSGFTSVIMYMRTTTAAGDLIYLKSDVQHEGNICANVAGETSRTVTSGFF